MKQGINIALIFCNSASCLEMLLPELFLVVLIKNLSLKTMFISFKMELMHT